MAASSSTTLVSALAARGASAETARGIRIASLLFITVLTIVAAQVSIPLPFTAVPLTLQPMIVLLGGLALGSRLGSASQILYLAAGIAGLPVFAASATLPPGPLRLLGPTGGYLMAYPIAAFVTVKDGVTTSPAFANELKQHVVRKIGGIARPDEIIFAADLPKTRSGKIMRRLLRDIAEGKTLGDTTTLADPAVIRRLNEQYEEKEQA